MIESQAPHQGMDFQGSRVFIGAYLNKNVYRRTGEKTKNVQAGFGFRMPRESAGIISAGEQQKKRRKIDPAS